tara:strand:+ start:295 stop:519 length:225 start_codon:yes stop_codon:yes gene_type:complete
MSNFFKAHLNAVGETYFQHLFKAFSFGIKLILIALRAFIHAIFPWFFEYSVSEKISELNDVLQNRKKSKSLDKN